MRPSLPPPPETRISPYQEIIRHPGPSLWPKRVSGSIMYWPMTGNPIWLIIEDNPALFLAGVIVVFGLLVYGAKDLLKLSFRRAWAISGVCFAESVRRRVLLITPLAILGIILVSQLQRPIDEADAIRQTIKVAMFATGLIVCVVTIILACTSLPKEIENRVIYTVVTKPTTRLEIVLGKTIGFARVSAAILIIMGLFTWGYLEFRQWNMLRMVQERLQTGDVSAAHKGTLEHYREKGLLSSKEYANPVELQVYSRFPTDNGTERWVFGNGKQNVLVPFTVSQADLAASEQGGAMILARIQIKQRRLTPAERKQEPDPLSAIPATTVDDGTGPINPNYTPTPLDAPPAQVAFAILDRDGSLVISQNNINGGKPVPVPTNPSVPIRVDLTPKEVSELASVGEFFVQVLPQTIATQYGFHVQKGQPSPVALAVMDSSSPGGVRVIDSSAGKPGAWASIQFRVRHGTFGQQLSGGPAASSPVAIYSFYGAKLRPDAQGDIQFEMVSGIERNEDTDKPLQDVTNVQAQPLDLSFHEMGQPVKFHPESRRTAYFQLPASELSGGNFSIAIRSLSDDAWVGLKADSLKAVVSTNSFVWNLTKSLFILWLMSILVIVICIFCSTFLSWPIAIVLTVVLLLGHWGVQELGDATNSGIGNQVATDLGFSNPAQAKVVSTTVESLTKMLNVVSTVLPDISKFQATEDLERGISLSQEQIIEAVAVLFGFGIPLLTLAYVFLKNKEVAP